MDPEQLPLRDLHLPDPVGWWPPAPGWWLLAGLALLGAGYLVLYAIRQRRRGATRRFALRELARVKRAFEADGNGALLGLGLSALVRRTMLAYAPRREVAGLTGEEWLCWLDRGLADKPFSEGPGRTLCELPYRVAGAEFAQADLEALVDAVRRRLRTPVAETA